MMISMLLALAAAAQGTSAGSGTLIGCLFPNTGPTKQAGSYAGFGIYLTHEGSRGPVDVSMIDDPAHLLGRSGFEQVESGAGWMRFTGKNALQMVDSGGGIYTAEAKSETGWKSGKPGICQVGA